MPGRLQLPLLAVLVTLIVVLLYRNLDVGPMHRRPSGLLIDKETAERPLPGHRPLKSDGTKKPQEPSQDNAQPAHAATPEPATTSKTENDAPIDPDPATSSSSHAPAAPTKQSDSLSFNSPPARAQNAIVTAVWDANYASFALMLGWSLQQHNNLTEVNAELVLLTLDDPSHNTGLTAENHTRLENVGWKIRVAEKLNIAGVDTEQIIAHRKLNLNKLQQFGWGEYDKIVYLDADVVCKGSIKDLFSIPGPFAAAPDVWPNIPIDSRFNSGVMVFNPSASLFKDMMERLPELHDPHEGDQDFLQKYWKYKHYGLPFKYNLNIVMHESYRDTFNWLWQDAVLVHYTIWKPTPDPMGWCVKPEEKKEGMHDCVIWPIVTWYREYFTIMLKVMGFENEIGILG